MGKNINDLMKANLICNMTEVDLSTSTETTVYTGNCILLGVAVNATMSAHDAVIRDGSTAKINLAASTEAGFSIDCHGAEFTTSIVVESNASGTGKILIFWSAI